MLVTRILLLLFYTSFLGCFLSAEEGYDCEGHLNRENKIPCAVQEWDCGACIPGFAEDEGQRIGPCYQIEVTVHPPARIIADRGDRVELPCEFSGKVKCGWTRDGQLVDTQSSYGYYVDKNETTNCTLIIESPYRSDSGNWQCVSLANSNTDHSLRSKTSMLKLADSSYLEYFEVDYGDSVTLPMAFEEPTQCQWWFKPDYSESYKMADVDDFEYVDQRENSKVDCSIRIKYTGKWNESIWINWARESLVFSLTFIGTDPRSTIVTSHPPPRILAHDLDKVTLPCEFSKKVRCSWTHDGFPIDRYESRYIYVDEEKTTNCTLVIAQAYSNDAGIWQCVANRDFFSRIIIGSKINIGSNIAVLKILDVSNDEIIPVSDGNMAVLPCLFHEPKHCEWWIQTPSSTAYTIAVIDSDEIEYVDEKDNPKTDCSIRLNKANKWDASSWGCWGQDSRKTVSIHEPMTSNEQSKEHQANDTKQNEQLSENYLRIYFKNKLMNGKSFSHETSNSSNVLKCETNRKPSEMRWTIDKEVLSSKINTQTLDLKYDEIDEYYSKHLPHESTLQCDTIFSEGDIFSVFATIKFPEPKLITQPNYKNKVEYEKSIRLPCVFETPVKCGWTVKNNNNDFEVVSVTENYRYADESEGRKMDCSLVIERMSEKEEGGWICHGYFGQNGHVQSPEAIVMAKESVLINSNHKITSNFSLLIILITQLILINN